MNPSPYLRLVLTTLTFLVLVVFALFGNIASAAVAPVVVPEGDVMVQTGWYTYEKKDNAVVLYCVPEGEVTLTCLVYVLTPKGNGIVLVEGIVASETGS